MVLAVAAVVWLAEGVLIFVQLRMTIASNVNGFAIIGLMSLAMDSPELRPVQSHTQGTVVEYPEVGGLHYHYERLTA